jgi:hypothetical protein
MRAELVLSLCGALAIGVGCSDASETKPAGNPTSCSCPPVTPRDVDVRSNVYAAGGADAGAPDAADDDAAPGAPAKTLTVERDRGLVTLSSVDERGRTVVEVFRVGEITRKEERR